jgi:hypothetical protein
VALADIDRDAGGELIYEMRRGGLDAVFVEADVADEAAVQLWIQAGLERFGHINVLINNAGLSGKGRIWQHSVAEWDRILAVNLRGPYLCAMYAAPHMPAGGVIINIASTRALMSEPNTEPYSASKGGLLALTHALAMTLAKRRIRVSAVSPGWIDVSAWKKGSTREQAMLTKRDHEQHPVGRVGSPEDIAEACLFLADADRAGYITGQNFVVDGGMTRKMIYEG